jgi:hypothetical protein
VREVLNRALGTGVVALLMVGILGTGLVPAPLQASARAGGLMAGHATFGRGDFFRFGGQPLVRPGQAPPVIVSGSSPAFVNPMFGLERERHHRRFFGFGLPVAGVALSYGPYDQPIAGVGVIVRPVAVTPAPENGDRIDRSNHGECRSETRMVASEDGGERPINITWCRKG